LRESRSVVLADSPTDRSGHSTSPGRIGRGDACGRRAAPIGGPDRLSSICLRDGQRRRGNAPARGRRRMEGRRVRRSVQRVHVERETNGLSSEEPDAVAHGVVARFRRADPAGGFMKPNLSLIPSGGGGGGGGGGCVATSCFMWVLTAGPFRASTMAGARTAAAYGLGRWLPLTGGGVVEDVVGQRGAGCRQRRTGNAARAT